MVARARVLPNKLYFRIGEVSDIVGVKPYVLRYWETEFSDVKPSKSKSGQRLYKRRDVELLLKVRDLLYEQRFTIDGAKQKLKDFFKEHREEQHASETHGPIKAEKLPPSATSRHLFERVKTDLEGVLFELEG